MKTGNLLIPYYSDIMLSICIGIYNWDVTRLVAELHRQACSLSFDFEILLIDDGSKLSCSENVSLVNMSHVRYIENKVNTGRSAIRNQLAYEARFPYLLFMDCDTTVRRPDFLKSYVEHFSSEEVVSGGYAYPDEKPDIPFILRWYYGKRVEEVSASLKNRNPYFSFSTFNFLIPKAIFNHLTFDESLTGYGHEDTLFGWQLKKMGIGIHYIDNSLLHEVNVETKIYLRQTEQAVENLLRIVQRIEEKEEWIEHISLLRFVRKVEHRFLLKFLKIGFLAVKPLIIRLLNSRHPSIKLFNFYKAGYLATCMCQKRISLLGLIKYSD